MFAAHVGVYRYKQTTKQRSTLQQLAAGGTPPPDRRIRHPDISLDVALPPSPTTVGRCHCLHRSLARSLSRLSFLLHVRRIAAYWKPRPLAHQAGGLPETPLVSPPSLD
jgi:hypothetical protein